MSSTWQKHKAGEHTFGCRFYCDKDLERPKVNWLSQSKGNRKTVRADLNREEKMFLKRLRNDWFRDLHIKQVGWRKRVPTQT